MSIDRFNHFLHTILCVINFKKQKMSLTIQNIRIMHKYEFYIIWKIVIINQDHDKFGNADKYLISISISIHVQVSLLPQNLVPAKFLECLITYCSCQCNHIWSVAHLQVLLCKQTELNIRTPRRSSECVVEDKWRSCLRWGWLLLESMLFIYFNNKQ